MQTSPEVQIYHGFLELVATGKLKEAHEQLPNVPAKHQKIAVSELAAAVEVHALLAGDESDKAKARVAADKAVTIVRDALRKLCGVPVFVSAVARGHRKQKVAPPENRPWQVIIRSQILRPAQLQDDLGKDALEKMEKCLLPDYPRKNFRFSFSSCERSIRASGKSVFAALRMMQSVECNWLKIC